MVAGGYKKLDNEDFPRSRSEKIVNFVDTWGGRVKNYIDKPIAYVTDIINFKLQSSSKPIESTFNSTTLRVASRTAQKTARMSGQAAHLLFNVSTFVAKQPFNAIRKPISMVANIAKYVAIRNIPRDETNPNLHPNKLNEAQKEAGWEAVKNARDTVIAWGTIVAGVMTLGAAPVALATLGVGVTGVSTIAGVNAVQGLGVSAYALSQAPTLTMAINAETVAKAAYLGAEHHFLTPEAMAKVAKEGEMADLKKQENIFKSGKNADGKSVSMKDRHAAKEAHDELKSTLAVDALNTTLSGKLVLGVTNAVTYIPRKLGAMEGESHTPRNSDITVGSIIINRIRNGLTSAASETPRANNNAKNASTHRSEGHGSH